MPIPEGSIPGHQTSSQSFDLARDIYYIPCNEFWSPDCA